MRGEGFSNLLNCSFPVVADQIFKSLLWEIIFVYHSARIEIILSPKRV